MPSLRMHVADDAESHLALGSQQIESYRSNSSELMNSFHRTKDGVGGSTRRRSVSSRSTSCGYSSTSETRTPPLRLQAVLVPKHVGPRNYIELRYRVHHRHTGVGGFGQVFVADDKHVPGRQVAVKKISLMNASTRRSFHCEQNVIKQLDHPCIVRILETYENAHTGHVVLELLEGGDAFDRLADVGTFPEDLASSVLWQVASALRYAHARGIAHRDVKPENVCFCSRDPGDDRIKLIDWGAAFLFREGKMCNSVGSIAYSAPEMAPTAPNESSADYTEACDLWSLGVTAYVLLSGTPPFWGEREQQLKNMRAEQFPMVGSIWSKVSEGAKDFIRALLRADPAERLTAQAALDQPFLKAHERPLDSHTLQQVFQNMQKFNASSAALSRYARQVARHSDQQSSRQLHRAFLSLDEEGLGELSKIALQKGFVEAFGADVEVLQAAEMEAARLDVDGSGPISFTEFCAAALGGELCVRDAALQAAFLDLGVQDGYRQDVLSAILGTRGPTGLADWLLEVRIADMRGRTLELSQPSVKPVDGLIQASFYKRLCCFVCGRARRPEHEPQRCFVNAVVPWNVGEHMSGMTYLAI